MTAERERLADVVALPAPRRDLDWILDGLRRRSPEAALALHDRTAARVNRLLWRLLGADPEHNDLVHEVYLSALASVHSLRDPAALDAWIVGITVNTVRLELRRRRIRRFFRLQATVPDSCSPGLDPEQLMLVRRYYAALDLLGADERIAYTLRIVDQAPLGEVADACGCSLATAKRRVAAAVTKLRRAAERDPVIAAAIGSLDA
jgi:RNA polymerase sigma-70 factor (ECF subfamily)